MLSIPSLVIEPIPVEQTDEFRRDAIYRWRDAVSEHYSQREFTPRAIAMWDSCSPEVLELMRLRYGPDISTDSVYEAILAESERRLLVAASNDILCDYDPDGSTSQRFVVQHPAYGLRIVCTQKDASRMWGIHAKSYGAGTYSLDESPDDNLDAMQYVGFGIGEKLYRYAAGILPEAKFASAAAGPGSIGLRAKLHRESPHTWEDRSCQWCSEHGVFFASSSRDDARLKEHPKGR